MAIKKIAVENVGQAFLELLREREIEVFLANAGTDFASIVDGFAKFRAEGKMTPRPLLVPHEHVAVSMAHGYYLASGKIAAVMVHVTVGTANAAQGIVNAPRARAPLLFLAGRNPITEEGLPGSRNVFIHWAQEAFDQGGMLREYVKWEYELRNAGQLEAVVDRALEQALAPPQGVASLMLPREVLAQPLTEITVTSPARRAAPGRLHPEPAAVEEAARLAASAKFPPVLPTSMGRDSGDRVRGPVAPRRLQTQGGNAGHSSRSGSFVQSLADSKLPPRCSADGARLGRAPAPHRGAPSPPSGARQKYQRSTTI